MSNVIIYYSRSGSTELVAKTIKDEVSGELVEIKDKKKRSGALGYLKGAVDAFANKSTEIEPKTVDLTDYDTIYVGTPVWASKPTPAILKLLEDMDFTDKEVVTFSTLLSSGGEATNNKMNEIIESKGGKIIKTFSIITKNKDSIKENTIKALND